MLSLANSVGNAAVLSYFEAHYDEGSDTPSKVVFVSSSPLVSEVDPKQLNAIRFLLQNYKDPDKVHFIASQDQAENLSQLQNRSVVKRKVPSPPRKRLSSSSPIDVSSSSSEDDED